MPEALLVLLTFDDAGSLGSPPHQVFYPPDSMVLPWVTASRFLVGNSEAELNPPLYFQLYFSVFSCLSSSPNPSAI